MTNDQKIIDALKSKEFTTMANLIKHLNLKVSGFTYTKIKNIAKKHNIDTSYMVGQRWSKDKTLKFKRSINSYLNNEIKISSHELKLRLIKENIKEHKCENCSNSEWINHKIPLELHHIDGNKYNNNLNNLQILCPNCHALTSNWAGKNRKDINKIHLTVLDSTIIAEIPNCQSVSEVIRVTGLCHSSVSRDRIKQIMRDNNLCLTKRQLSEKQIEENVNSRKIPRPSPEELKKMVWEKPTVQVAKDLGISDKSIEKWCKFYNIPKPPVGYWSKKHYNKL